MEVLQGEKGKNILNISLYQRKSSGEIKHVGGDHQYPVSYNSKDMEQKL